jgi:hypothetical protein
MVIFQKSYFEYIHMDENQLIQQLLSIWQSMAPQGLWVQDGFLLFMSVIAVMMLFFSGTVIGLFLQSLWGIFITHRHTTESES